MEVFINQSERPLSNCNSLLVDEVKPPCKLNDFTVVKITLNPITVFTQALEITKFVFSTAIPWKPNYSERYE